jgi:hypothetical protein
MIATEMCKRLIGQAGGELTSNSIMKTKPQPVKEGEPIIWRLADEYVPTHNEGMWSRIVITITNYGTVIPLTYCGGWRRPVVFVNGEFVEYWIDFPYDSEPL